MSQKLLINKLEWTEDIFQFNEDFVKSYNEEIDGRYFPEADIQYSEKLLELHNDLPFLQVKAGNTSKKLLNQIRRIIYSLYRAKKSLKKYITI